jgi:glycosyltransferase involved in cell wall biosynthesis
VIVGVDACPLVEHRTGIGNFIHSLLSWMYQAKPAVEFILYSNTDIHFSSAPNITFKTMRTTRRGALWHQTRLAPALIRDRVDVFWGANGYAPLALPRRIRSVLTVHDLVWHHAGHTMPRLSYWSRRLFQPAALRVADRVIAVSEATSLEVRRKFGRTVDAVIPPVVSPAYCLAPDAEKQDVAGRLGIAGPYLLAVGTLEPRKNFDALIGACLDAHAAGYKLPGLVIAGRRGWLDQNLNKLIGRGEQAGLIKVLGFVPDEYMRGLYAGAAAFIQPSLYEGFGMPVVEAQLCGTPALIADIPSLLESSSGMAVRFAPTREGIRDCLVGLARQELPLVCRMPGTIDNSPCNAGGRLWQVFEMALMDRAA